MYLYERCKLDWVLLGMKGVVRASVRAIVIQVLPQQKWHNLVAGFGGSRVESATKRWKREEKGLRSCLGSASFNSMPPHLILAFCRASASSPHWLRKRKLRRFAQWFSFEDYRDIPWAVGKSLYCYALRISMVLGTDSQERSFGSAPVFLFWSSEEFVESSDPKETQLAFLAFTLRSPC